MLKTVAVVLILIVEGCNPSPDTPAAASPSDSVRRFKGDLATKNYEEAEKLVSRGSVGTFEFDLEGEKRTPGTFMRMSFRPEFEPENNCRIVREEVNGDHAKVFYEYPNAQTETLDAILLVKESAAWKIDLVATSKQTNLPRYVPSKTN